MKAPIALTLVAAVAATAVLYGIAHAVYSTGFADGKAACEATQTKTVVKQAKADIKRADITGRQGEQSRRAIDTVFAQLADEAAHEKPNAVDSCVLPAERLRRWNAANTGGGDTSAATGQPDGAAAATAVSAVGPGAGAGSEPPRGSQGLPPAGRADVQPAGLSAD